MFAKSNILAAQSNASLIVFCMRHLKVLFTLILILIVQQISAQDYVVKLNGDTLRGQIVKKNPQLVIINTGDKMETFSSDSLQGYRRGNGAFIRLNQATSGQETPYLFSVSAGVGLVHGFGGLKAVFGYKGDFGIMATFGNGIHRPWWQLGAQVSVSRFTLSVSYGVTQTYHIYTASGIEEGEYMGVAIYGGGRFSITKNKRFFGSVSFGYSYSKPVVFDGWEYSKSGMGLDIGFGVRF
jgi:hypothetical protein